MKENIKYYDLNLSQEVVQLQCKYTIFKRIINILTSISTTDYIDFNIMKDAFNKVIQRNDCLRIKFIKKDGKLMQFFAEENNFDNIPIIEFKTERDQKKFINKLKKKPIKYLKGKVIEPYFIKTYDNKNMIFLKVCHYVLDIYGINIIFKDLYEVYNALKNSTELPAPPSKFEDVLQKDLIRKNDEKFIERNQEYFDNLLENIEQADYAGIHGNSSKIWQKQKKKHKHTMKMFFINNKTKGYRHKINKDLVKKITDYCKANGYSPANFLFYTCSICASKTNGNIKNMFPLELCNCRGTALEKNCAGTKVQSIACYTTVEKNKTFKENFDIFSINQAKNYRHVGFSDQKFQMMLHKRLKSSFLETYYSITFSFIPYTKPENYEFLIYSNERCALPAYLALLYDTNSGDIVMAYDCQTKIITENDVDIFHKNYVNLLNQIVENPNIKIADLKIKNS